MSDTRSTSDASNREPLGIGDEATFESFVQSDGTVLVDFYADWCGPCKQLAPKIETVAERFPSQVGKVDVDEHPGIAQRYNVRSIPIVIVFQGGEGRERFIGVQSTEALESALE